MAVPNTHMLKERKGKLVTTLCGTHVDWATVWRSDVTCPACLELLGTPLEHKRLEQPLEQDALEQVVDDDD
jgi:hypothetical protein